MVRIILTVVWDYLKEGITRFKEYWHGLVGGCVISYTFLFDGKISWPDLMVEFAAKLIMACILIGSTTFTTLLIKDLYKEKVSTFIFRKKSGSNENNEKRA